MIWQSPWAWAGLATLALPILIHLLGRGNARVAPFPTLRFFPRSRLLPTRRTRLHDLLLLVIRLGVLAAAVAALAQPLVRTAARRRHLNGTLARAIIVDTSASMLRPTGSGESVLAAARREVQRLADSAQLHVVLETATPSGAVSGAVAWLDRQEGRAELVVVSDFQVGALDARDLVQVPGSDGIRLVAVAGSTVAALSETRSRIGGGELLARTTRLPDRTEVEWSRLPRPMAAEHEVEVLAGPAELAGVAAIRQAVGNLSVPLPVDTTHSIAVVYPLSPDRAALLRQSSLPSAPWMGEVVRRLHTDSLLLGAVERSNDLPVADTGAALVIMRTSAGRPAVLAAQHAGAGKTQLVLFALTDPGSLVSAALMAATSRARSLAAPGSELEPSFVPDSLIRSWQRSPETEGHPAAQAGASSGVSDGRWLWLLAVGLLVIEAVVRRRRAHAEPPGAVPDAIA